jgi:hypothetical protein
LERVRSEEMKSEERGKYRGVMWPAISYLVCYCIYIFGFIFYWSTGGGELLLPAMIGIVFVFPSLGLCHLLYLLFLFFGGNKKRVKPHFVSVLCSLVLTILSYATLQLGYFPSV